MKILRSNFISYTMSKCLEPCFSRLNSISFVWEVKDDLLVIVWLQEIFLPSSEKLKDTNSNTDSEILEIESGNNIAIWNNDYIGIIESNDDGFVYEYELVSESGIGLIISGATALQWCFYKRVLYTFAASAEENTEVCMGSPPEDCFCIWC